VAGVLVPPANGDCGVGLFLGDGNPRLLLLDGIGCGGNGGIVLELVDILPCNFVIYFSVYF
jgi:hypothetical protein